MKEEINPAPVSDHELIINEYYRNGYNGTRAVMEVRPHIKPPAAGVIWSEIKNNPKNKAYIQELKNGIKARAQVDQDELIRELLNHAYSDATQYINLKPEELKRLPPEARRAIQSIKATKRTVYDKKGNKNIIELLEVKVVDKLKALDMLAKNTGLYEADNGQKAARVNILQLLKENDPGTLNKLLLTIERATTGQQ